MMVNAYPNDIDDARSRRQIPLPPLPSFSHLYAEFYPHRGDFLPTPDASGSSISPDSDSLRPLE